MKIVILAGGLGTRLSEETTVRPKPMVEIGGKPILWHILKIYSSQGFNDFIICLGYKGYVIKEYFANYHLHMSNLTFDFSKDGAVQIHQKFYEPWKITLVDTGDQTMTGGRVKRIADFVDNQRFMMTYGDGVADIDLAQLLAFHERHGKTATVTAIQPPGRFGALVINEHAAVDEFREKPVGDGGWVNGGFFVLEPDVFEHIADDHTVFEAAPLASLASQHKLFAYKHRGFWWAMDTLRDKSILEGLWASGQARWKTWS